MLSMNSSPVRSRRRPTRRPAPRARASPPSLRRVRTAMTAKLRASSTAATLVVISLAIVALPVWATACRRIAAEPAPGIILISIDTPRADHLGAYGHTRPTSPFFDALARRGVLFENAIVQL